MSKKGEIKQKLQTIFLYYKQYFFITNNYFITNNL